MSPPTIGMYVQLVWGLMVEQLSCLFLVYPDFQKDFTVKSDVSGQGLGAILSQTHSDGKRHPVAYASKPCHQLKDVMQ